LKEFLKKMKKVESLRKKLKYFEKLKNFEEYSEINLNPKISIFSVFRPLGGNVGAII
jgi:hypothetical protein